MFRLFLTKCKSELSGLVEGLLGKKDRRWGQSQRTAGMFKQSDNGFVLMETVMWLMQDHSILVFMCTS